MKIRFDYDDIVYEFDIHGSRVSGIGSFASEPAEKYGPLVAKENLLFFLRKTIRELTE